MLLPEDIIEGRFDDHLTVASVAQLMREARHEVALKTLGVRLRSEVLSESDMGALRVVYLECSRILSEKES